MLCRRSVNRLFCSFISCALIAVVALFPLGALFAKSVSARTGEDSSVPELSVNLINNTEGYASVLYDNTNGLPTSEANAIAQTSDGFIWIGSYSGLIRYDGNTFERYDSTSGITSVVSLYADSQERLWIGTNDNGAAVMDRSGNVRMFNRDDGLPSLSIRAIVEDSAGMIYLGTTQGIVKIDADYNVSLLTDQHLADEYVRDMRSGKDNVIYGVTIEGNIFTIVDGAVKDYYSATSLGISDVHSIVPDDDHPGFVYIGTKTSTIYYGNFWNRFKDPQIIDASPCTYLNSLFKINGDIWICADSGIGILYDTNEAPCIPENIVPLNSVEEMMVDYQGNIWFVSSKQGVLKIVPNQFTDISETYGLSNAVINSTCLYNGMLLIGGKDNGLTAVDDNGICDSIPITSAHTASGAKIETDDLLDYLDNARIRSLVKDSQGRLWISTFGDTGLVRFDNGEMVRFGEAEGLPSTRTRVVCERSDGSFAVACTGGVAIIRDDVVTELYDEHDGIGNTEILTICEADNGDLFVGTDGGGLYVISADGGITLHDTRNGLASDVVMRVKKSETADVYWLVMSSSIGFIDADRNISTILQFPYSNNFDMYEDGKGNVWILSSNGIYVASIDNLLANGEIETVFYGTDNGLPCIATSNSYSELADSGDLYIAGTTGVCKVNIKNPLEDMSNVKISVPYVEADGVYIYPDENGRFTVPSGTDKLTIYSYVFTYSLMNPQISYQLEGFDKTETVIKRSDLAPLVYTNLRGRTYNFVIGINDPQVSGDNQLTIQIVKKKAFYEMAWFYIVIILAIAFVVAHGIKIYIRKKTLAYQKKEEENRKLIREMVEAFAKMIDMKDKYTKGHSMRVGYFTRLIAEEMGFDKDTVEKYENIALMHDIGKIGIKPEVLNKPGKLTDEEFETIKSHSQLGYEALAGISIMPELAIGAGAHHERPDGRGYPNGLKDEEIPMVAKIIAVADTFDAMYSDRPYRKRMELKKVISIIKEVSGTQLDSKVVDAFLRLVNRGVIK